MRNGRRSRISAPDCSQIAEEIERISGLDLAGVRALWRATYNKEPPGTLTRDLLVRQLAWRNQEKTFGGHDAATLRLLAWYRSNDAGSLRHICSSSVTKRSPEMRRAIPLIMLFVVIGSRRRLDTEFILSPQLHGKAVAMTIDSFARQVWCRWRSLGALINAQVGDFNQTCDACGRLLEHPAVARWVARSYPIIVVDEAQELAAPRLRIITALVQHCAVFVAADEFQCLDENLDTGPFLAWFNGGEVTQLEHIHRTARAGLLAAGANLRHLVAPAQGPGLQISHEWANVVPFKIGAAIVGAHGSVAVLYPPAGATWAHSVAQRLGQGLHSANFNIGPIALAHEPRAADEVNATMAVFAGLENISVNEFDERLAQIQNAPRWLPQVRAAILGMLQKQGKVNWSADEMHSLVERKAANFRAYSGERRGGVPLLSIHQAKNRQFDHVIVLWPHGVPGSDELKARLLYNGITRARQNCKVFVRAANLLQQAPFSFGQ